MLLQDGEEPTAKSLKKKEDGIECNQWRVWLIYTGKKQIIHCNINSKAEHVVWEIRVRQPKICHLGIIIILN